MIILNVQQGSHEWHSARANHNTASEAPAMMGTSPYMTRTELLRQKSTKEIPEFDPETQRRFDKGHEIEAFARPLAEAHIDEELFPVTATDDAGWLLASFDGLTMDENTCWECKTSNATLRAAIESGDLPDSHWPQVEQQLLISGAERCVFTISDGTAEGTRHLEYRSNADRRQALISGWRQFDADLAEYVPPEVVPAPTATPQMQLPSVSVNVSGAIAVTDNLRTFGDALQAYVERINKQPQTDDDFATLEAQAKDLKRAEDALTTAEDNALGQAADIDTLRKTVAHLREIARQARLSAEKIVKAEKENRKNAIIQKGIEGFRAFRDELARRFPAELPMTMPDVPADFYGAAKGLKTLTSIQNAISTELARVKIDASSISDKIAGNLRILMEHEAHRHLFADYRMLALKDADDLQAVIAQRISAFNAEQDSKLAAERERIQKEEEAKAVAKLKADADQSNTASEPAIASANEGTGETPAPGQRETPVAAISIIPPIDNGARINLGTINATLGITVSAGFLAGIGIEPVGTEKRAILYRKADFPAICHAIADHVMRKAAENIDLFDAEPTRCRACLL